MVHALKAAVHLLLLAAWQFSGTTAAGESAQRDQLRLASAEEGEAIVQAAWQFRKGLTPKPDCSHFVNAVYSHAGFAYEYQDSKVIYHGIDSFARVPKPQPGDVVVWRGHMGIVVDPEQHSFYSSVPTGFAIEDYHSGYWRGRGSPRFYRYRVDDAHAARLQALPRGNGAVLVSGKKPQATGPVVLSNFGSTSEMSSAANSANERLVSDTRKLEENDISGFDPVFVSAGARPSKDEIVGVITRNADAAGERLLRENALSSSDVSVAERLTVRELTVHENSGSAELEIKQAATIQSGKVELSKATLRSRLMLRRDQRGWVVLMPRNRIYMQPALAVKILVNKLAKLPDVSGSSRDVFNIVHALDGLLAPMNRSREQAGAE